MSSDPFPARPGGEMYRAGLPSPGARLLAAIRLVQPGRAAADIGCDHGKLAVYLALAGISPKVVAVDNRPMPLAKAKALARQTGCEDRVDCRLGDGLAALQPGEAQEIIIAGMSGETMANILSAAKWVEDSTLHFVFVPATRAGHLRRWLAERGFAIDREEPVEEKGRYYTAISAVYTGTSIEPTPLFCELGLVPQAGGPAAAGYIRKQLARLEKQALAPMELPQRDALEHLINEVKECLP